MGTKPWSLVAHIGAAIVAAIAWGTVATAVSAAGRRDESLGACAGVHGAARTDTLVRYVSP